MSVEQQGEEEADKKGLTGEEKRAYVGGIFNRIREKHKQATPEQKEAGKKKAAAMVEQHKTEEDAYHRYQREKEEKKQAEYAAFLERKQAAEIEAKAEAEKRNKREQHKARLQAIDDELAEGTRTIRKLRDELEIAERSRYIGGATTQPRRGDTQRRDRAYTAHNEKLQAIEDKIEAAQKKQNALYQERKTLI